MDIYYRIKSEAEAAKRRNESFDSIEVTVEEYAELVKNIGGRAYDPMPQPPVSSCSSESGSGLFSSWASSSKTYDHHAPEYLRRLEEWQARQQRKSNSDNKLMFYGPTGPVTIRIKQ